MADAGSDQEQGKGSENTASTALAAALAAIEQLVNQALRHDPATAQQLTALDGCVVRVECTAPQQSLYILFVDQHLELWSLCEVEPQCVIRGSASALFGLMQVALVQRAGIASSGVEISGDVMLLQRLADLAANIDIDWEAVLAQYLGDVVAHGVGKAVRATGSWWQSSRGELQRLLSEYLQEEVRLLPTELEVQKFCREVDELNMASDRFFARLRDFQRQQKASSSNNDSGANYDSAQQPGKES